MKLNKSLSSLTTICSKFRWQTIVWMWVQIRAQFIWCYFPINCLACWNNMFSWNPILCRIKPLPHMCLFNRFVGFITQNIGEFSLAIAKQFNNFLKVLFHKMQEYTHSYYRVNNFGYLKQNNHSYIFKS